MIDIILLLIISLSPCVLIFKNLCKYAFMVALLVAGQVHSSSMDSIKLVLDVSRGSWGSLSTCCTWITIVALCNGWSRDI